MPMTNEPIFQSIFGADWLRLPAVMHKHYANRPFCRDRVTVEGSMNIEVSVLARLLAPFMRLTGALAPIAGKHVPVTVHFDSQIDNNGFGFNRIFHYPNQKPYHFRSNMVPIGGAEVIETMPSGIGWQCAFLFDGQRIIMAHRGYCLKLWGKSLPLPLEWILGKGYAEEEAIDDDRFRMHMHITHPIFGKVYAYSGTFTIKEMVLA